MPTGNDQRSAAVNYGGSDAQGAAAFLSYVYHAPWGFTSQGALYAMMWRRYMAMRGMTEADLGEVAVAQRLAASLNPNALMRKRITIEGLIIDRVADGKVKERWEQFDQSLMLQQLGFA